MTFYLEKEMVHVDIKNFLLKFLFCFGYFCFTSLDKIDHEKSLFVIISHEKSQVCGNDSSYLHLNSFK